MNKIIGKILACVYCAAIVAATVYFTIRDANRNIIKDVTICLNRCFGGKEGPFMTTIQDETYLSVARNGFLIKTT